MKRKREPRGSKTPKNPLQNFTLREIRPLTESQGKTFDAWDDDKHLVLNGLAGTGKSYIAIYLALEAIKEGQYKQLVIVRSAVASRSLGFLPGNLKEKSECYEDPYRDIVNDLYGRGDAYDILKNNKVIDFKVTSYLRGLTIEDSVILVDEYQNLSAGEHATIITRSGDNTKFIWAGDYEQSDLVGREKYDTLTLNKILDRMGSFAKITFGVDDIVRSGLVREFLIAKKEVEKERQE